MRGYSIFYKVIVRFFMSEQSSKRRRQEGEDEGPADLRPDGVDNFRPLSDGVNLEADLTELLGIDDSAAVKDEGRLLHRGVDGLPVESLKLVPLGCNDDSLGILARRLDRFVDGDLLFDCESLVQLSLRQPLITSDNSPCFVSSTTPGSVKSSQIWASGTFGS